MFVLPLSFFPVISIQLSSPAHFIHENSRSLSILVTLTKASLIPFEVNLNISDDTATGDHNDSHVCIFVHNCLHVFKVFYLNDSHAKHIFSSILKYFQSNPAVKKKCAAPGRLSWKKMWVMAKSLIMWIQMNCAAFSTGFSTKFTWIVIKKKLPSANHHSHLLAATVDFTSFTQQSSWGPHTFLQLD